MPILSRTITYYKFFICDHKTGLIASNWSKYLKLLKHGQLLKFIKHKGGCFKWLHSPTWPKIYEVILKSSRTLFLARPSLLVRKLSYPGASGHQVACFTFLEHGLRNRQVSLIIGIAVYQLWRKVFMHL